MRLKAGNLALLNLHNKNETLVLGSSTPVLGVKIKRGSTRLVTVQEDRPMM